jgi:hypothetical protein
MYNSILTQFHYRVSSEKFRPLYMAIFTEKNKNTIIITKLLEEFHSWK